jgi:hypothetical membrane protein
MQVRSGLPLALGVVLSALYIALGVAAAMHYPHPFSPLHDWLSDLGNRRLNPHGALFYRIGSALGGITMIAFFASLAIWRSSKTVQSVALTAMQLLGALAGAAFIMTAIYPADLWSIHDAWSKVVFLSFSAALVVSLFAFPIRRQRHPALIAITAFCWLSVLADGVAETHWLEWTSVGGFLAYLIVFGLAMARTSKVPVHNERASRHRPSPGGVKS